MPLQPFTRNLQFALDFLLVAFGGAIKLALADFTRPLDTLFLGHHLGARFVDALFNVGDDSLLLSDFLGRLRPLSLKARHVIGQQLLACDETRLSALGRSFLLLELGDAALLRFEFARHLFADFIRRLGRQSHGFVEFGFVGGPGWQREQRLRLLDAALVRQLADVRDDASHLIDAADFSGALTLGLWEDR